MHVTEVWRMLDDVRLAHLRRKRDILRGFVDRIEAEKERARLWYAFPLAMGPMYECPQRNSNPRRHLERVVS